MQFTRDVRWRVSRCPSAQGNRGVARAHGEVSTALQLDAAQQAALDDWTINNLRPETKERVYARTVAYVYRMCEQWRSQAVISVHPMIQHATACLPEKAQIVR